LNTENSNTYHQDDNGEGINSGKTEFRVMLIPLLVVVYFMAGFTQLRPEDKNSITSTNDRRSAVTQKKEPVFNFAALLANEEFSKSLRDTVYTDKDKYLELRIDEQTVYVYYKDGHIKKYPVSSGNKFLNKGIESRPGLFAIFMKEELHLSSQFDDAKMYYYMPFNMGIGFHSLAGTGYYGNLGVRPSSHGCIRMANADAKELFKQCEIGTLVLADRGKSARVIAFAPEGFKNDMKYTKEQYMEMLAYNLNTLYEGKFLINPPKRFIIDPAVIPRIGFNVGTTDDIPNKQQVPVRVGHWEQITDRLNPWKYMNTDIAEKTNEELSSTIQFDEGAPDFSSLGLDVDKEMVDKLAYNRIGILPYFPPVKDIEVPPDENTETQTEENTGTPTDKNIKAQPDGNTETLKKNIETPKKNTETPPDRKPETEY
jgi:hypothetical protein